MEIIILVAIILIGAAVLVYVAIRMPEDKNPLESRLAEYAGREQVTSLEEIELELPFQERVLLPTLRSVGQFVTRFTPAANIQSLQTKLDLAGNPGGIEAPVFWASQIMGSLLVGGLILFVFLFGSWRPAWWLALVLAGAAFFLGYYIPRMLLESRIRGRQHNIRKAMPDALDLLTICVEAGLGFDSAMSKVNEEWENELSHAFGRVIQEIRLGKLRKDALRDMAERVGINEMTSFVAAVIQSEQLGVSMSRVLRIQADQMRMRRRQAAEESARRAPVLMMVPLVFLIFPSILVVLLGPAGLILMTSPMGTLLFGGK
jgi:tight adherence protein C